MPRESYGSAEKVLRLFVVQVHKFFTQTGTASGVPLLSFFLPKLNFRGGVYDVRDEDGKMHLQDVI